MLRGSLVLDKRDAALRLDRAEAKCAVRTVPDSTTPIARSFRSLASERKKWSIGAWRSAVPRTVSEKAPLPIVMSTFGGIT